MVRWRLDNNSDSSGTGTGSRSSTTRTGSSRTNLPPPTTLGMTCLMVVLFVGQQIIDTATTTKSTFLNLVTMCPRNVLYLHEYYRIVTSCLFHANVMHIGMNMMSWMTIGTVLEKRYGTVPLWFVVWWSVIWTSTMYLLIAYVMSSSLIIGGYDTWMYNHSVGYSGVLFHMLVLECNDHNQSSSSSSSAANRSIFGVLSVPPVLYPWVLLVVLQFIMPNLSFVGHLSGILTGTLQTYGGGFLDRWFLPSQTYLMQLENETIHNNENNEDFDERRSNVSCSFLSSSSTFIQRSTKTLLRRMQSMDGYVMATNHSWTTTTTTTTSTTINNVSSRCWATIISTVGFVLNTMSECAKDCIQKLVVLIFGRGDHLNANIRIWPSTSSSSSLPTSLSNGRRLVHPVHNIDNNNSDQLDSIEDYGRDGTTEDYQEMRPLTSSMV